MLGKSYAAYIGIDPGMKGGIAIIYGNVFTAIPMPILNGKIDVNGLSSYLRTKTIEDGFISGDVCCYIEQVGAYPLKGSKSIWSFGFSTGMIHTVVELLHIPIHTVRPQEWKKSILPTKDHSKLATIDFVSNAYPFLNLYSSSRAKVMHDGMADAICIALYGRKQHET